MIVNNFVPLQPWRTQVHVLEIDENRERGTHEMRVELPGWDRDDVITIDTRNVPRPVMNRLVNGDRLYAYAALGAQRPEDLKLRDWQLAEPHEALNGR